MAETGKNWAEKYVDFTTPIALLAVGIGALVGPAGAGIVAGGLADLSTKGVIKSYAKKPSSS